MRIVIFVIFSALCGLILTRLYCFNEQIGVAKARAA